MPEEGGASSGCTTANVSETEWVKQNWKLQSSSIHRGNSLINKNQQQLKLSQPNSGCGRDKSQTPSPEMGGGLPQNCGARRGNQVVATCVHCVSLQNWRLS